VKALVTGATGFVGSHLVEALIARGYRVNCLVRNPRKATDLYGTGAPVHFVAGDLADQPALERAAEGVDLAFHAAGLTGARRESDLLAVNRDGTARLLAVTGRVAPRLARFVYISSMSAAGPSRFGTPRRESEADAPVSAYGRSKLAAEAVVRGSPLPWTIVRPPSVYGPRDREFLRLFQAWRLPVVPSLGSLAQELSFVHARDLAHALIVAATATPAGRTYYASHPEVVTARQALLSAREAARQARRRTPGRDPVMLELPPAVGRAVLWVAGGAAALRGEMTVLHPDKLPEFQAQAWTCSTDLFHRETGWRAGIAMQEGFIETARWYHEHHWL
jgi:nucleoside-diphosphate-sugar epimerase